jgi:hypothetical protein
MLAQSHYDQEYIDACRKLVADQLTTYRAFVAAAAPTRAGKPAADAARRAFEPRFFGNLVLVLDQYFLHRGRGQEGKDGNPINEVRMLCNSMLVGDNRLTADKTIKYRAEASVLKLGIGDEIALTEADFVALSDAYFDEIRTRFS